VGIACLDQGREQEGAGEGARDHRQANHEREGEGRVSVTLRPEAVQGDRGREESGLAGLIEERPQDDLADRAAAEPGEEHSRGARGVQEAEEVHYGCVQALRVEGEVEG